MRSFATAVNVPHPQLQTTTLPNGLTVATESHPHAQTATVGVWIDAGSRAETGMVGRKEGTGVGVILPLEASRQSKETTSPDLTRRTGGMLVGEERCVTGLLRGLR